MPPALTTRSASWHIRVWSLLVLLSPALATVVALQGCGDQAMEPTGSGEAPAVTGGSGSADTDPGAARTGAASLASAMAQNGTTTLATDKDDYQPGERVVVTGTGWEPGETVVLEFLERPTIHPPESLRVLAGGQGEFQNDAYVIQDHDVGQGFQLTASGFSSGSTLQVEFTDATFGVSPSNGPADGGTVVTLSSSTPFSSTATYTVQFGTAPPRAATYVPATGRLQVTTPAGPPGSPVDVMILENGVTFGTRISGYFYWGPPEAIVFSFSAFETIPTSCTPLTLRLFDRNDFLVPAISPVTITLSSTSSGGVFYDNWPGCSNPTTSTTIAAGSSLTPQVGYLDSQLGVHTLTATSPGLISGHSTARIRGPASTLRLTQLSTAQAEYCVVLGLTATDAFGTSTTLPTNVSYTLAGASTGQFYLTRAADGDCQTLSPNPLPGSTFPAGTVLRELFYRDPMAGSVTFSVLAPGLTSATLSLQLPKPARKLVFLPNSLSAAPGACTSLSIRVVNEDNVGVVLPKTSSWTLTSTSHGQFFSNSTCTAAISSITVSTGSGGRSVWYRDADQGNPTLTASTPGLDPAILVATIGSPSIPTSTALAVTSMTTGQAGPTTYGESVRLRATVTGTSGTPTGAVAFIEGGTCTTPSRTWNTAPVLSAGYAEMSSNQFVAGSHGFTACYVPSNGSSFVRSEDSQVHTVQQAPLTVTGANAQKAYGDPLPSFTVSYSGFVLGQTPGSQDILGRPVFGGTLAFETSADQSSPVQEGGYLVTPSGLTAHNYAITFRPGTLTVTPAPLTVTAEDKIMFYGATAPPPFTVTYNGFKLAETAQTAGVLGGSLDFSGAATTVGATSGVNPTILEPSMAPYDIMPGGLTSINYAITFVPGRLTVRYNDAHEHVLRQPINTSPTPTAPSPISAFKLGSTVPVKFQIVSGSDDITPVSIVQATIKVTKKDGTADVPINETVVVTPADAGTSFRYDAMAEQYVFNLGTKNLTAGTYSILAQLDDGSTIPAMFDLRAR